MRNRVVGVSMLLVGIAIGGLVDVAPALAQDAAAGQPGTEDAPARTTEAVPEGQPRYLAAMRTELEHMGIEGFACNATDAQRATCELTQRGPSSRREFRIRATYSDRTDTVYVYVERFLVAPSDAPTTDAVMRRLMELNWQMLLGKLEWDPSDGEVRLAMVLNTDSNFDRRAFRSAIRGLTQIADRYWSELDRIQRGQ